MCVSRKNLKINKWPENSLTFKERQEIWTSKLSNNQKCLLFCVHILISFPSWGRLLARPTAAWSVKRFFTPQSRREETQKCRKFHLSQLVRCLEQCPAALPGQGNDTETQEKKRVKNEPVNWQFKMFGWSNSFMSLEQWIIKSLTPTPGFIEVFFHENQVRPGLQKSPKKDKPLKIGRWSRT